MASRSLTARLGRGKKVSPSTIVAAFMVMDGDQIIMVSNGGQIIRCPINQISIVGRGARGVTVFKVAKEERLVSVSRLRDESGEDENGEDTDVEDAEAGDQQGDGAGEDAQGSEDNQVDQGEKED